MGKLLEVMNKVRWCRGQLSADTIDDKDWFVNTVGHYATTVQEYIQVSGRDPLSFTFQPMLCGAVCAIGTVQMAMGNLKTVHNSWHDGERGEAWFNWVLTSWATNVARETFDHWFQVHYSADTRARLGWEHNAPSLIGWNDDPSTAREDVYQFMVVLEQEMTMAKLLRLSNMTPPEKRQKFETFKLLFPLEWLRDNARGGKVYNWDLYTTEDVFQVMRKLMPVQNIPYKLNRGVPVEQV